MTAPDMMDQSVLEETGLIWHEDSRQIVDPETGEVFPLDQITDEATATAATYRIACNDKAIEVLDAQIKSLSAKKKARVKRGEWLRAMYLPGLQAVAKTLMKKGQSTLLGYCTVGFSRSSGKVSIVDEDAAASWVLDNSPSALKLTIDVGELSKEARERILEAVRKERDAAVMEGLSLRDVSSIRADVRVSFIDESLKATLPKDAFEFSPAGTENWYARVPKR